jgi:predicted DNA-binding protein
MEPFTRKQSPVPYSISVTPDLRARIEALVVKSGQTRSFIVRAAIIRAIGDLERELAEAKDNKVA